MKLTFISDTHNKTTKKFTDMIPKDTDILIHSGDALLHGSEDEWSNFLYWLNNECPGNVKIYVPGNHDIFVERNYDEALEMWNEASRGSIILIDEGVEIEGVEIYGTPWTPKVSINDPWAFNFHRLDGCRHILEIPKDVDILISHGPPNGILDYVRDWRSYENLVSVGYFMPDDIKPKIHSFGHIHECGGQRKLIEGTWFVNASVLDERYTFKNKPQVCYYEDGNVRWEDV